MSLSHRERAEGFRRTGSTTVVVTSAARTA